MSTVPTGLANENAPCFLLSTGGLVQGVISQRNNGVAAEIELTAPYVIAAGPNGPGGTATVVQLLLVPTGGPPATSVDIVVQAYDSANAVIYSRAV